MGDFEIGDLWLLLAVALVTSFLFGATSIWLAKHTLSTPVPESHNGALSPLMTSRVR